MAYNRLAGLAPFKARGMFCEVFCKARTPIILSLDSQKPRRSVLNLRISGDRGRQKCRLLYEASVGIWPELRWTLQMF
jgi:hypothetical protein